MASAEFIAGVDWWDKDERRLQPLGYRDKPITYKEQFGFTKEELERRKQAPRIDSHFQSTPKVPCELNKTVADVDRSAGSTNDRSGLRAKSEPSDVVLQLHTSGNVPSFLRTDDRPSTTPLHDLCASTRLLTLTGLSGTLKRNPLACNQTDSHNRTPLHWLMLSPKLDAAMLTTYLNFQNCACKAGLQIVDSHGECSPLDYFMEAHQRIGYKKWLTCFKMLSEHPLTAEKIHTCDVLYATDLQSTGTNRSAVPLQKFGGRVNRIRCDGPSETKHYQSNPQMMHQQLITERSKEHPDEIKGYELRTAGNGTKKTKVGGVIGNAAIVL